MTTVSAGLNWMPWHIPSCLEGHFMDIRRGVELYQEEVMFFITFTNVFLFLSYFFTFLTFFNFYLNVITSMKQKKNNKLINDYKYE